MLTSLVCLVALNVLPAQKGPQKGQLEIVNPRTTFGALGATRPKGAGALPGDVIHFSFDVKNLKFDAKGEASYSMLVEIFDPKGELTFKIGPIVAVARNHLGGDSLPCSAHLEVPLDAKPGAYAVHVTVEDRAAKKQVTFKGAGKVLPADFGIVRVGTFSDSEGRVPTPPVGVTGETLHVNFAAVGFARSKKTGQPDISLSLRVLDEKGKPTLTQPLTGHVKEDVGAAIKIIPLQFGLTLNRLGRFTIEITATDNLSGKKSQVSFPLRVTAAD